MGRGGGLPGLSSRSEVESKRGRLHDPEKLVVGFSFSLAALYKKK